MQQSCKQCRQTFEIFPEDQAFYREMDAPAPTLCYFCRMIRRFSHRNEQYLYHRKCDSTKKQIISSFSADKPFPVYSIDAWWSDQYDPLASGRPYDFSRPFFEQFLEVRNATPRLALQQQLPMENSDFCHAASRCKNCYLLFASNRDDDCYYGCWVNDCRSCIDGLNIEGCELCYECVSCRDCYDLKWSRDCTNCKNAFFLRYCSGCSDCFGGSNLVNRQYVVFNEQKTKEQYVAFLAQVNTGSFALIEKIKTKVDEVLHDPIAKCFHGTDVEHCRGDYLRNCRNAFTCFECDRCEDVRYCMCLYDAKNCMDHSYWGGRAEQTYECMACGYDLFHLRFCNICWSNCSDLTYCDNSFSSRHCFGCSGLKKNEYCILNKQYTKQEYEDLVPRIIEHMRSTGEWGEFFPASQSAFCYNESLAQQHEPLTKAQARTCNLSWHEEDDERGEQYLGPDVSIPDDIRDVQDDLCSKIVRCSVTGKPFKIIPQELKFYREHSIPLPRSCPDERYARRRSLRNPRRFWMRHCQKCKKAIETTYAPECPETVFCEACYLSTVY